jgi:DNA-binding LacI/PurR family transcriptional regulator
MSGVSRSTASRALRGQDGVRPEVRERVERIASSLGYRPNRAAQNLAGASKSLIGLITGDTNLMRSTYTPRLIAAIGQAAETFDQGLLLLLSGDEPGSAVKNLIQDQLVDGVIVSSAVGNQRWIGELQDQDQLSIVFVGARLEADNVHFVDVDNVEASATATEHLFAQGCERVGVITGPSDRVDAQLRLQGYRLAHDRRGMAVDESLIQPGNYLDTLAVEGTARLVDAGVDGIFATSDLSALGVLAALRDLDIDVPRQIKVMGFDGAIGAGHTATDLSTMVQPFDELAAAAVGSLVQLVNGEDVPRSQILPATFHQGQTT